MDKKQAKKDLAKRRREFLRKAQQHPKEGLAGSPHLEPSTDKTEHGISGKTEDSEEDVIEDIGSFSSGSLELRSPKRKNSFDAGEKEGWEEVKAGIGAQGGKIIGQVGNNKSQAAIESKCSSSQQTPQSNSQSVSQPVPLSQQRSSSSASNSQALSKQIEEEEETEEDK